MFHQTKYLALLVLAALACLCVSHGLADDKKGKNEKKRTAEKPTLAAATDFSSALGLDLQGLTTIGSRIDQARTNTDPVTLALIATELGAAEKVSGKKAKLTSEVLRKEAIESAMRRADAKELKMLAVLVSDEKVVGELEAQAKKADSREALAKKGDKSERGIGTITVRSYSKHRLVIMVNDRQVGFVNSYGVGTFRIFQPPYQTTKLTARTFGATLVWGPEYLGEDFGEYLWELSDE